MSLTLSSSNGRLSMDMWHDRSMNDTSDIVDFSLYYLERDAILFSHHPATWYACGLIETHAIQMYHEMLWMEMPMAAGTRTDRGNTNSL